MPKNSPLHRYWRLFTLAALALTLAPLGHAPAAGSAISLNSDTALSLILELLPPVYEIVHGQDGLDIIHAEGFELAGAPGTPLLPRQVLNVILPPDAAPGSLSLEIINAQVQTLPGTYNLKPASSDSTSTGIVNDSTTHLASPNAAPASFAELLAPGQLRKWRFARLEFTPFRYDAASGELNVVSRLTVRLNYHTNPDNPGTALPADKVMDDLAREMFLNYETAQAWYTAAGSQDQPGAIYDYVIITTNAIQTNSAELNSFIAHKQTQGHSILTITEDEYGALTGQAPNGRAEKVRQWLIDNYAAYSIKYVLLMGDPTPESTGSTNLPMKMCWPRRGSGSYEEAPTDYFFADLTGNWDSDSDGYFGEWEDYTAIGGVDFANEVYVGRIPFYGSYTDLDAILQKIIEYETEPNPVWRENALLPMSFSTETYDGAPLAEQMMDDYLDAAGFASWTQYQQGNGACSLDSVYASDEELRGGTVVRNRWAANDYGLVLWWGHGSTSSASVGCDGCWDGTLFSSSYASYLDDDHPSLVYLNSCLNGRPESSSNLQYALLKNGGIGTVGATRVSWFNSGIGYGNFDGSTTNSGIGYEYAQRLVAGQAAGDALYNAKSSMSPESITRLMNFFDFNLYGDPSTEIYAGQPDLSITMTANTAPSTPGQAIPGQTITYTLTFANNSTMIAPGVLITDTIPISVTNTSVISSGVTITDTGVSPAYVWSAGTLAPGQSGIITITGVLASPMASGTFTNTAVIACPAGDSNPADNSDAAGITVTDIPVSGLAATNDSPTQLGSSTTLTATITTGTNVTYAWSFGDGQTGSGAVATHQYPAVGTYTATVTTTNSSGEMATTTIVTITNLPDEPITGLTATNNSPTILGDATTFTATIASGTNVAYTWSFGDGETGAGAAHTYAGVGVYTAIVTATNGTSTLTATTTVTVEIGPLASIVIRDAADGGGSEVETHSMITDESLAVHAAGYDENNNYISDVTVTWISTGDLDAIPAGPATSAIFAPETAGTSGTITADDGNGHTDASGTITVTAAKEDDFRTYLPNVIRNH